MVSKHQERLWRERVRGQAVLERSIESSIALGTSFSSDPTNVWHEEVLVRLVSGRLIGPHSVTHLIAFN